MPKLEKHPWRRRFAGLGLGFLLLATTEGILRLAGLGQPDPAIDPFVSFENTRPLFTVDPLTNTHITAPERLKYFIKERFPRYKHENTFRIFCLGGSTVQGRPYSIETSFTTWLRLGLEAAYPGRRFEVINCGGVSYASYRLIPILTECLRYQPDLFILCTGQNEFLEERTYQKAKKWDAAHVIASHLHLYHCLQKLKPGGAEIDAARPILKEEVDALLDYRGGLQAYKRDDRLNKNVQKHFRNNIQRLIKIARAQPVPILFLQPPVNLKDCPPFKSEAANSDAAALVQAARDHYQSDVTKAIDLLQEALTLDPRYARAHYELGQCYLRQADFSNAERSLWRAVEEDVCHLRMLPDMAADLRALCDGYDVPCLNLQRMLGKECREGLLGSEILVDHVHPSIRGHQIIAAAVQEHLQDTLGPPSSGWEHERQEAYTQHSSNLDALYYAHGDQRLRNLRRWTKGRADGPRFRPKQSAP